MSGRLLCVRLNVSDSYAIFVMVFIQVLGAAKLFHRTYVAFRLKYLSLKEGGVLRFIIEYLTSA